VAEAEPRRKKALSAVATSHAFGIASSVRQLGALLEWPSGNRVTLMLHCVTVRAEADRSHPCRAGTTSRITYEDWALVEAENWRQLRPHALEAVAGVLADAGRFGEAVGAAQAAVDADPLRESPHAALIAVHLREGNQSEALALARVGLLVIRAWVEVCDDDHHTGPVAARPVPARGAVGTCRQLATGGVR
jgi:hypothetical protein